ncbi:MAG TPA: hypothetical protein VGO69_02605 [Pyrinomonadaceae bacterium]|nr:hypothetical protein [Pyrinomonadaceae bacterium]
MRAERIEPAAQCLKSLDRCRMMAVGLTLKERENCDARPEAARNDKAAFAMIGADEHERNAIEVVV